MAISVAASGTQTAVLSTEHTLATITTPGTYVLNVDVDAQANGETLQLKVKIKTLSGGALRLAYPGVFKHIRESKSLFSIPVPVAIEAVFTLQQDGGTGRAYPWSVIRIDG